MDNESSRLLPATVLVGFLGAGKTTLLNHLLTEKHDRRLAVIVNDFSEINVDARFVHQASDRLVEMTNGCICCTLREDLVVELGELAGYPDLDGIVVESTGIGEPMPIAQAFHMGGLPEKVRLEEIVTVVDAANFWTDFARSDEIEDADGQPVTAPLAPLLVDQIEYSNVIVLNKIDLAAAAAVDRLEGFVRSLNPVAHVYRTSHGEFPPAKIHNTGLYRYDLGPETEGWDETWEIDAAGEADEYGFNTFTYLTDRPFVHDRFMALFEDWPDEVMRAKGFVTFVDHPPIVLSVVRDSMEIQTLLAAGTDDPGEDAMTNDLPLDQPDDEQTEIVFIGRGMLVAAIVKQLDACIGPESAAGRDAGPA